jgi:heptosyltransferase-2
MKILIIQTAFIGDLILTTSFIREVFKKYKNPEIQILVKSGTEDILANNPYIQKIISYDKKKNKNFFYFFNFLTKIRNEKFDICYSPHFSHRSSLVSFFSGAKQRIGYKEAGFSFLFTKKIQRPLRGIHEVDKLLSLLETNSEYTLSSKRPEIFIDESKISIKGDLPKEYISIAPSSLWETKRMPEDKFVELISEFRKKNSLPILLIGSKADFDLCEKIKLNSTTSGIFNFAGKTNLIELAYLISKSKLIVSNDSSPIHLASAFNIPTIMIYGATIPEFGYSTLADMHFISQVDGLNCRPCGIHGGRNCPEKHFKCMKEQNISNMIKEINQLLNK